MPPDPPPNLPPDLQPIAPSLGASPKSNAWIISVALVSSNMFALVITLVFEFLSLRGVVDVAASRIMLAGAGIAGVSLLVALTWGLSVRLKLSAIGGGSVLLCGLMLALDYWAPKPTVAVNPSTMVFDGSLRAENRVFIVQNQSPVDVYGVQLKLKFQDFGLSINDFGYDLTSDSRKPIIEGSDIADTQGMMCVAKDGRPVVFFWIYRLEPNEKRGFSLTHRQDGKATIDARISFFGSVQIPRTNDLTKIIGNLRIDEPMECIGGLGFWLDPSKPPRRMLFSGKKV